MAIITVVGAGMMGSAITVPAADNGHTIRIVGTPLDREIISHAQKTGEHLTLKRKMPDGITWYQIENMKEALDGADLLIGGVSTFGLEWFMENVIPAIPEGLPVLSITKGMKNGNEGELISYPAVYKASTDKKISFNAVGGPCISFELVDRIQTEVTFCGEDLETLRWIKELFKTDYYHISLSTDISGVECAVAMKNAYALGVSLAIGMMQEKTGSEIEKYNPQAALFGQSVKEMMLLMEYCGGHPSNISLAAGDLYVTIYGGRTRKLGTLLGKGVAFEAALEQLSGVTLESVAIVTRTAQMIRERAAAGKAKLSDFPLLQHMDELINQGKSIHIPFTAIETEFIK